MTPTEEREKVENEILLEWMPDRSDSQQYPDFNFWKTKEQVKGLFDALVDSRLELDRLRSENAELRKDAERGRLHKAAADKWVPCPDHRGKVSGGCYVCENESLRKRVKELPDEGQIEDEALARWGRIGGTREIIDGFKRGANWMRNLAHKENLQ